MKKAELFSDESIPSHIFAVPQLSFREDLCVAPLSEPWFQLAAWTQHFERNAEDVEIVFERLCALINPDLFEDIFNDLESIGNVLRSMGKPTSFTSSSDNKKKYTYSPFYQFDIGRTNVQAEPLVAKKASQTDSKLFINPDILLYFDLEEKVRGSGIWWDHSKSTQVVIHQFKDGIETVDIKTEYLKKYLKARQKSLLIGHYSHRHLFNPSSNSISAFIEGDLQIGSPIERVKAIFQNPGLLKNMGPQFLRRRLHLWFEIPPEPIDVENPWAEDPPFDLYKFTLPTRKGPVAPGRWSGFNDQSNKEYEGVFCDFMTTIFFRQEVLNKYETTSGFQVGDDGSVYCHHYWALNRSTFRVGNELIGTAIGDFAEGLPLEEWLHWKSFAVDSPGSTTIAALRREIPIPDAINLLLDELSQLNHALLSFGNALNASTSGSAWSIPSDSLSVRQLKWTFPTAANDEEFIKRATLASTLIIDGLKTNILREILKAIGTDLHRNGTNSLSSRNLLQRIVFCAALITALSPEQSEIESLVNLAEKSGTGDQPDLKREVDLISNNVREDIAPLAFLYDLRVHGGIAHPPNPKGASTAAAKLGLSPQNWHRKDFLHLISKLSHSIQKISTELSLATRSVWNESRKRG